MKKTLNQIKPPLSFALLMLVSSCGKGLDLKKDSSTAAAAQPSPSGPPEFKVEYINSLNSDALIQINNGDNFPDPTTLNSVDDGLFDLMGGCHGPPPTGAYHYDFKLTNTGSTAIEFDAATPLTITDTTTYNWNSGGVYSPEPASSDYSFTHNFNSADLAPGQSRVVRITFSMNFAQGGCTLGQYDPTVAYVSKQLFTIDIVSNAEDFSADFAIYGQS